MLSTLSLPKVKKKKTNLFSLSYKAHLVVFQNIVHSEVSLFIK